MQVIACQVLHIGRNRQKKKRGQGRKGRKGGQALYAFRFSNASANF